MSVRGDTSTTSRPQTGTWRTNQPPATSGRAPAGRRLGASRTRQRTALECVDIKEDVDAVGACRWPRSMRELLAAAPGPCRDVVT